jgi:hypothetical protein
MLLGSAAVSRKSDSTYLAIDTEKDRQRLRIDIKKWRSHQQELFPQISNHIAEIPYGLPENKTLLLPSNLSHPERILYSMEHTAPLEMKLWEGEAHDALQSLRSAYKYALSCRKQKGRKGNFVVGQELNTRAGNIIREADKKMRKHAAKYHQACAAMISLGLGKNDTIFPPLHDKDMWMKDSMQSCDVGDGTKTDGWIWRTGRVGEMSKEEHMAYIEDGACSF